MNGLVVQAYGILVGVAPCRGGNPGRSGHAQRPCGRLWGEKKT